MSIKAVFFDVDETLVDFDAAAVRAHTALFGSPDGYDVWCSLTPQFWVRFTSGELDFTAMRDARMARYLELAGIAGDATDYEARRWELVELSFEVYDDVPESLARLRSRGLLLGVITNNESVHQRRKLATVGLSEAFDAVVISGEVGHAKPSAEIFRHGCDALGVAAGEAMHVGDLLDVDARGAASAGLRGVWLDRVGLHDGSVLDVDVIAGLDEVAALL